MSGARKCSDGSGGVSPPAANFLGAEVKWKASTLTPTRSVRDTTLG